MLVDVTECEIERPQKTERLLFRQEEEAYKRHTMKVQIIADDCVLVEQYEGLPMRSKRGLKHFVRCA